jgi:hypothetical protein
MHDTFDAAAAAGVSIINFGANTAWWQARLAPDSSGIVDRTIVEYKNAALDPLASADPEGATTRFTELPKPRPARDLFGEDYGGIVAGLSPMDLGPDIAHFVPASGLVPGQQLPGLIGAEVDRASTQPRALILASTHVHLRGRGDGQAGAAAWLNPNGAHVFDAGTLVMGPRPALRGRAAGLSGHRLRGADRRDPRLGRGAPRDPLRSARRRVFDHADPSPSSARARLAAATGPNSLTHRWRRAHLLVIRPQDRSAETRPTNRDMRSTSMAERPHSPRCEP